MSVGDDRSVALLGPLWLYLPAGVWWTAWGAAAVLGGAGSGPPGLAIQLVWAPIGIWGWVAGFGLLPESKPRERPIDRVFPFVASCAAFIGVLALPGFGPTPLPAASAASGLAFFAATPAVRREPLRRTVPAAFLHMLAGAGFLVLLGPGLAPGGSPIYDAALGGMLVMLAWAGWTGLLPASRRVALGFGRGVYRSMVRRRLTDEARER